MGHKESIAYHPWPAFDSRYLEDDVIEIPIMINGKVKSKINISVTLDEAEVERLVSRLERRAVHVATEPKIVEKLKQDWARHVSDVPLDILTSEYRDLIDPLLKYLAEVEKQYANDALIVVIPQFVPQKLWQHFLYNKTAQRLRTEIEKDPNNHAQILEVPIKPTQFK